MRMGMNIRNALKRTSAKFDAEEARDCECFKRTLSKSIPQAPQVRDRAENSHGLRDSIRTLCSF